MLPCITALRTNTCRTAKSSRVTGSEFYSSLPRGSSAQAVPDEIGSCERETLHGRIGLHSRRIRVRATVPHPFNRREPREDVPVCAVDQS
jgi:hypothetical protein